MLRCRALGRTAEAKRYVQEVRQLDAPDEQGRRREEWRQKRRRMRVLRAALSSGCDRCDAEAAGFGHDAETARVVRGGGGRPVGL
jgi:hypothetical protein